MEPQCNEINNNYTPEIHMQTIVNNLFTPEQQQEIKDEGYRAHVAGSDMVKGNPHPTTSSYHWLWRKGYLEAFKDANGL